MRLCELDKKAPKRDYVIPHGKHPADYKWGDIEQKGRSASVISPRNEYHGYVLGSKFFYLDKDKVSKMIDVDKLKKSIVYEEHSMLAECNIVMLDDVQAALQQILGPEIQ